MISPEATVLPFLILPIRRFSSDPDGTINYAALIFVCLTSIQRDSHQLELRRKTNKGCGYSVLNVTKHLLYYSLGRAKREIDSFHRIREKGEEGKKRMDPIHIIPEHKSEGPVAA